MTVFTGCCGINAASPSVPVRSVPAGSAAHVSDVGPGLGHPGTGGPPSQGLRVPVVPPQRPARPVLPGGSRRRLLLPAGRPAAPAGRPEHSEDAAGKKSSSTSSVCRRPVIQFVPGYRSIEGGHLKPSSKG